MQAAVFEGPGKLVLTERPKPAVKNGKDALIRVTGVGICGTDLHILQVPPAHPAKPGIIQGHEFTGIIEELGDEVEGFEVGESVLIDPHPGCGVCEECRRGRPDRYIPLYASSPEEGHPDTIGIFSDGAMATHVVVPRQSLYKVSSSVPSHIAALAEPLACVVNAAEMVSVRPGEYVVILGAGPIGLLFTAMLRAAGASKLVVSEPSEYRRKAAASVGADIVIPPGELEDLVRREMPDGADVVVEAVGPLLPQAIHLARAGGRVLQFGHDESVNPEVPVGELLKKELTIRGAFIGRHSFQKAARIMESGKLPLENIVSHRLPLSRVHQGIETLTAGHGLKIILEPGA